jgi:hypothetical protein
VSRTVAGAKYFALGGRFDPGALGAYLDGGSAPPNPDHDVMVHALNETFDDRGQDHPVAYRRTVG